MKNVLVPIDYSDTSLNAAAYAVKMLTGIYGINMILYHVYEKAEHAATADQELKKLKITLFETGIVKIETVCEQGNDFVNCLEKFTRENKVEMIIMGITGRNKIGQTLIGSNTLKIVQKNICPVLIVPPGAQFVQLKNFSLASDFIHAPSPVAAGFIKNMLSSYFAKLHIVNVNPAYHISITEEQQKIKSEMDELFKGFEHAFYFIDLFDLQETINLFVNDHHIDIIITLPKDHSRFSALLETSNTKRMAYQSTIPVLAIHH
jgi:nucleotide-binding universal stress UspA family protein